MAEPILLHVIRPLVKPYYVSLDSCVDIFTSGADFAVLFFTAPIVWIRLVTHNAWSTLQKTFSSGSLPRPGGHAVSASDPDEPLNDPITPGDASKATSTKGDEAKPDPLQRFVPKTRAYVQHESDDDEILYKNPLRDDPPPYGLPVDLPTSIERDYPPVFSTRRGTSRSRPEGTPGARSTYPRRMSIDHRPPYLPDSSSVTSVSYRPESEVGGSAYGFSPGSQGVTNGAGDLVPDTDPDIPSFALSSPEHLPVSVSAAPAIPSYLQPRTRASRANLNPNRQRVDSYADRPNPRASAFLEGERGMTFADKPKEAKGLTPEVAPSYVSPPPSGYGVSSPPMAPTAPAYGNPYAARGRTGHPSRPYSPADDGYDAPHGGNNRVDLIQGWRQRSAIPPEPKHRRAPSAGGSAYPYQAAESPYMQPTPSLAPSFPSPSIAPSFPVPSIAPSLAPSQSISNVHARPQPGYRPQESRPATALSGRPPTATSSHPPTTTTGMGLGLPRRKSSTRELRAQVWEPKEDDSAAEAERLREEERREVEKKETDRLAALERQRRKVSDSQQQFQRTVRGKKLTGDVQPTRTRGTRSKAKASGEETGSAEGEGF
jgi:hypothetical protein